ncbi:MAG: hypothetical protein U0228_24070 [Myxococcaceae bacterium]
MEKWLEPLREGPGDPKVLRVLADALLERGETAWSEAIQLALDLEHRFPGEDEWIDGHRKLRRLIDAHGARWQTLVWGPAQSHLHRPTFYRGVPTRLSAWGSNPQQWLNGPLGAVDVSPGLDLSKWDGLALVTEFGATHENVSFEKLRSVTHLAVRWDPGNIVKRLAAAPFLAQLESLRFSGPHGFEVSAADLDALWSLKLPKLRTVTFEELTLGASGAEVLAAKLPATVVDLSLVNASLGAKGAQAVAHAKWLPSLKALTLARDTLGDKAVTALAAAQLDGLVSLRLNQVVNAKTAPPLLERKWPNLRELSLNGCPFKGKAAGALTELQAPKLTVLHLGGCALGDDGLAEVAKAKLPKLRQLNLNANSVKGPGMVALGKSKLLSTVEELWVSHNKFQNTGAKGLADSKHLGSLRELSLGHNWMGSRGLQGILKAAPKLERVLEGMNNYGAQLERSFAAGEAKSLLVLAAGSDSTTDVLEKLADAKVTATLELLSFMTRAFDDAIAERLVKGPVGSAKTQVVVYLAWCNALTEKGKQALSALGNRVSFA